MASKVAVLIAGVDTLIINMKVPPQVVSSADGTEERTIPATLPGEIEAQLFEWQESAKKEEKPYVTPWEHEGLKLKMQPRGTNTHRYLLCNGLIDVLLGPLLHNGALARVRFMSEYLWRGGADVALLQTHAFLWNLFHMECQLQCAEIHLCADVANFALPRDYEPFFISRAATTRPVKVSQLDKPVYRYHRLETLQFSGHGNPISATIYNKPAEIEQKRQEKRWFYELWKRNGWNGESPVWRIECRIKREALHEMDIEDTYDALMKIPALWTYCVGHVNCKDGWLRMVQRNPRDSNRRRWKTDSSWVEIQRAFEHRIEQQENIAEIQRERKRQVNLDRAEKAIAGYTTTYGAWLQDEIGPDDDPSIVLQRLYTRMLEIWEKRGTDFHEQRIKKQFDYHIS